MKIFCRTNTFLMACSLAFFVVGCGVMDGGSDEAIQGGTSVEKTIQWVREGTVPQAVDIDAMGISQEIDNYVKDFIELYTSNTFDDTMPTMIIEEKDIPDNIENVTSFIVYSDLSGKRLRYKLNYYGETGNQVINYYLCESFVWISRQSNYYSSWILTVGYSDVLYSQIDNWIIMGETVYKIHDNGELEEMEETQLEVPLPEAFAY